MAPYRPGKSIKGPPLKLPPTVLDDEERAELRESGDCLVCGHKNSWRAPFRWRAFYYCTLCELSTCEQCVLEVRDDAVDSWRCRHCGERHAVETKGVYG